MHENTSNKNWIGFKLQGRGLCNRDAIGSSVKVKDSDGKVQRRHIHARNGLSSQNDIRVLFAIKSKEKVKVEVNWCGKNKIEYLKETSKYHDLKL